MNGLHRRLLKAFVRAGGDLGDSQALDRFAALVRTNVLLLTARTRRAVELALEGGEDIAYDAIALELSRREGHPVTAASVRQRVSRGGRLLEAVVLRSVGPTGAPVEIPTAGRAMDRRAYRFPATNGNGIAARLAASRMS